ncbi:MAG: YezD family protein [Lachnospiraceae bacterium]|nr:YezD family protein [Oscillospiraceae bacterium]MDY5648975.1 YezD family protein [Lachnospiraceae bacterium]
MEQTKVTREDLQKIKAFIESVRFGSVSVIIQDGKIVQIEKHEKMRLTNS